MNIFKKLFHGYYSYYYLKELYNNPEKYIELEFYNETNKPKLLWIEPSCEEIELECFTEFLILTHDKCLRIQFESEENITLWMQHSFGFKLFKRKFKNEVNNKNDLELVFDTSNNN